MAKLTPSELNRQSQCYADCIPPGMQLGVIIDLLASIQDLLVTDPATIMDRGMLMMIDNVATIATNVAPVILTGWTQSAMLQGITANAAAGTMTIGKDGIYSVRCSLDADTTTNADLNAEIYVDGNPSQIQMHLNLTAGEGHHGMSMSGILELAAGEVVTVRVSSGAAESLNVEDGQLVIHQLAN